ncbi:MAG: hypothetical protein HYY93_08130 [Planctomycetes bacterium]|nr:hypothetical protein [Planctomycetota bacterium]
MRRIWAGLLATLFVVAGAAGCHQWTREDRAASGKTGHTRYDCPFHPTMESDRPGNCPKCGRMMKRMEASATEGVGEGGAKCDCGEDMPDCKCPHCKGTGKVCPCEEDECEACEKGQPCEKCKTTPCEECREKAGEKKEGGGG